MSKVSPCEKPTYYFDAWGNEVSYEEHARYIESYAVVYGDRRVYPMLKCVDAGDHICIYLIIDHYESKPRTYEHFQKATGSG